MIRSASITFVILVIAAYGTSLLLGGCDESEAFPAAAREAVEQRAAEVYTDSFSGEAGFDQVSQVKFLRAWPADDLPEGLSGAKNSRVWCVELSVKGERQGEAASESPVWVAIQEDPGAEWSIQPLVMFSAIWPYESCGKSPGDDI
jgi:hypothetical protein